MFQSKLFKMLERGISRPIQVYARYGTWLNGLLLDVDEDWIYVQMSGGVGAWRISDIAGIVIDFETQPTVEP